MKREERKVFNGLKRNVNENTINVAVNVNFSTEAKQAIHELLTIEKGMYAEKVCWNWEYYAIFYVPAGYPAADAIRQQQESMKIDDVVNSLRVSDYTWTGHKKPTTETTEATEATETTETKGEKTMCNNSSKKPVTPITEKIRAAFLDAKKRLDAGEEMHVHFSNGNTKTNMPSVDLLPLFTCHGRCRKTCGYIKPGKCLPDCYACRIVNRFPDTLRNYAENTVLAMFRPEQYWAEIDAKMKVCRFMRLFVSGDAIIKGYFSHLCDALENNPHLEMQGFSKCYEVVNREIEKRGALPKNLHLLLSGWNDMQPVNPYNLPTTNIYENERPETWLSCGGDCANCACVGLGCWKATAGDVVGFKKH